MTNLMNLNPQKMPLDMVGKLRRKLKLRAPSKPVPSAVTLPLWSRLSAGRRKLTEQMPYLESMLLKLVPKVDASCPTMAVTANGFLLLNEDFVVSRDVESLAMLLAHEVCHVLFDTIGRARRLGCQTPQDHRRSNYAADIAINQMLIAAGMPVDENGGITHTTFGLPPNLTHEEYYDLLKQGESDVESTGGDGEGGEEKEDGEDGEGEGEGEVACGRCGSGGGQKSCPEPDEGHADGRKPGELEQARRAVAQAVRDHQERGRGTLPGGWDRWTDEVLSPPKVPWARKLEAAARRCVIYGAGARESVYDMRSRRQAGLGFGPGAPVLARYRSPKPKVEVWFDTSGSMGDDDLAAGLSELPGVLGAAGAEVTFGAIDADVHGVGVVRSLQDVIPLLKGGGGTNFAPLFDRLETMPRYARPHLVIFVTDGDAGGVPSMSPNGIQFIWLCVRGQRPPCEWGEMIDIGD